MFLQQQKPKSGQSSTKQKKADNSLQSGDYQAQAPNKYWMTNVLAMHNDAQNGSIDQATPIQKAKEEKKLEEKGSVQMKPVSAASPNNAFMTPTIVPSEKHRQMAQRRKQEEDIRQNKPKGMNSNTYLKLSDKDESSKIMAKAKFAQYKKDQVKQLKRDKQSKIQFNSRVNNFENALIQRKIAYGSEEYNNMLGEQFPDFSTHQQVPQTAAPVQKKENAPNTGNSGEQVRQAENKTGLPDNLKSGIEHLSGMDISDVRVQYNSSQPAQMKAHAFAQGTDIHVAPGQEKHLPHEAWHVVQQKQGRVKPTVQMKEEKINDDIILENEADIMGAKATRGETKNDSNNSMTIPNNGEHSNLLGVIQRNPPFSDINDQGIGEEGELSENYKKVFLDVEHILYIDEGQNIKEHNGDPVNLPAGVYVELVDVDNEWLKINGFFDNNNEHVRFDECWINRSGTSLSNEKCENGGNKNVRANLMGDEIRNFYDFIDLQISKWKLSLQTLAEGYKIGYNNISTAFNGQDEFDTMLREFFLNLVRDMLSVASGGISGAVKGGIDKIDQICNESPLLAIAKSTGENIYNSSVNGIKDKYINMDPKQYSASFSDPSQYLNDCLIKACELEIYLKEALLNLGIFVEGQPDKFERAKLVADLYTWYRNTALPYAPIIEYTTDDLVKQGYIEEYGVQFEMGLWYQYFKEKKDFYIKSISILSYTYNEYRAPGIVVEGRLLDSGFAGITGIKGYIEKKTEYYGGNGAPRVDDEETYYGHLYIKKLYQFLDNYSQEELILLTANRDNPLFCIGYIINKFK